MKRIFIIAFWALMLGAGCTHSGEELFSGGPEDPGEPPPASTRLLPSDLEYQGAFRLPRDTSGDTWEWSGVAGGLAYRSDGNAGGEADGYPGSLYATGHAWRMQVAEFSIPAPAVPVNGNPDLLPMAVTLQDFHPVPGRLVAVENLEIMRAGLEYLPPGVAGNGARLFFCWAEHFQADGYSHGSCDPDLSVPAVYGPWRIDGLRIYAVNDYLFRIPKEWSAQNAPGRYLATGRFRDGGWSGQGPALIALESGGFNQVPAPGAALNGKPLILYTSSEDPADDAYTMDEYHHSDEWTGGAWIDFKHFRAVVFVGTKGRGNCWYGDRDGPCLDCRGERGWWSDRFEGGILFYDPQALAEVARGEKPPHAPQPYAFKVVDHRLLHISSEQQWHHLGPCAWDGIRGILYIAEPFSEGDRPIIHVWKVDNP